MDIEVDTKQRLFNQQTQLAKITAQIKDNEKTRSFTISNRLYATKRD